MQARHWLILAIVIAGWSPPESFPQDQWAAEVENEQLTVSLNGQPLATYIKGDAQTKRPFFARLRTAQGRQVTRSHPPVAGQDSDDHADMHPGLWLSFGDLSGHDFWRNKAVTKSEGVVKGPEADATGVRFTSRNVYLAEEKPICRETCSIAFEKRPAGYLIRWRSLFEPLNTAITFGDQEEMGLGVRMHTPLIVQRGGRIRSSDGLRDEKGVWGKPADWCEYSGAIEGRRVGVATMPSPANFRPAWWHVRDYGLMVANPFGRNALTQGTKSSVEVDKKRTLELNFGVLIFDVPADVEPDIAAEYRAYSQEVAAKKP